ncbi:MAG: hypothetical protein M1821_006754 [Bathelium mastoideum]|nr:MAG: hypothetical protein M1821_006754 [Bathelium mastoideum]
MPDQRDRRDGYYDDQAYLQDDRGRWQSFTREKDDRNLPATYGANGAMVPYDGDAMNVAYDGRSRRLRDEAYERAFRRGYEDAGRYDNPPDQYRSRRASRRSNCSRSRGRRGYDSDSEDTEDDRDHKKRSKSRKAKGFFGDHFDVHSDMGLVAGVGGGLAGAAIGRKVGNRNTVTSVAGAIAGAVAANALENQWKKHRKEADKRLDKEEKTGDMAYGQDQPKKKKNVAEKVEEKKKQ